MASEGQRMILKIMLWIFIIHFGFGESSTIVDPPSNITVVKSSNATFKCKVENQQASEVFFWYKLPNADGIPESPLLLIYNDESRDESKYTVNEDYTLAIRNVSKDDEGLYQCSVGNNVKQAYLNFIDPPQMTVRRSDFSKHVSAGERFNITCEARNAYPPVTLRWFKGSNEMTTNALEKSTGPGEDGYGETVSIVEVRVTEDDYMNYMLCVADVGKYEAVAVQEYDFDFGAACVHKAQNYMIAVTIFSCVLRFIF